MSSQKISIRAGRSGDAETIARFLRELGEHDGPAPRCRITQADVLRFGFGERPCFETLIAERADEPVGLALFYPIFSTWDIGPGLFVNDFYVSEHCRGMGIGRVLLSEVARIALARGCTRVEWHVLIDAGAHGFYRTLGARRIEEFQIYRLADDGLARLAAPPQPSPAIASPQDATA
jgi:GNAT superfamily N-acetyltransferase